MIRRAVSLSLQQMVTGRSSVEQTAIAGHLRRDIGTALLAMFMSLIEMQAHIDFDEAHKSKENGDELEIRCNGQGCIA